MEWDCPVLDIAYAVASIGTKKKKENTKAIMSVCVCEDQPSSNIEENCPESRKRSIRVRIQLNRFYGVVLVKSESVSVLL